MEFKDKLMAGTEIAVTPESERMAEIIDTCNQLKLLVPAVDLKHAFMQDDNVIHLRTNQSPLAVIPMTTQEFLEALPMESIELPKEYFCSVRQNSGLAYIEVFKSFVYITGADGVTLNSLGEPIPTSLGSLEYLSVYAKYLPEVMPVVSDMLTAQQKLIKQSQVSRGFTTVPKVGDVVKVMPYEKLVALYGESTTEAGITYVKALSPSYGIAFIKEAKELSGIPARIASITKSTGEITLEAVNASDTALFRKKYLEVTLGDGELAHISLVLHEQVLEKVDESI